VIAQELARSVAAFGLPGHDGPLLADELAEPLEDEDWRKLIGIVSVQRLSGYLHAAVQAGALAVTAEQRDQVDDLHLRCCASALRLERILLELATHLERAGIEFVVLKGTASAHLVHEDPSLRMFGDNDLLFRSERFEDALGVLVELGYERVTPPPTSAFARRFAKGATMHGPAGDEVDAHRNLVFGTFGFQIDLEELFTSSVVFPLGGRELRALGPETRLLHACYHAALGDPVPRLSSVRDVAQMLVTGGHDPDRLIDLARRWRAEPVLARSVELCRRHLGVDVGGSVVAAFEGYEPTRRERRAIASYVGTDRSFAAKVLASLPYLDGVGERVVFLRASLAPSAEFAESRARRRGRTRFCGGLRSLLKRKMRR
jgi:hypothetical protein